MRGVKWPEDTSLVSLDISSRGGSRGIGYGARSEHMPVALRVWKLDGEVLGISGVYPSHGRSADVCEVHCPTVDGSVSNGFLCSDGAHHWSCDIAKDRCRKCIPGKRGKVSNRQSRESRKRMVERLYAWAEHFRGGRMAVLTYGKEYPLGQQVEAHRRALMKRLQRWCDNCYRAFWQLEAQYRGAPHFNLVLPYCAVHSVDDVERFFRDAWMAISGNSGSTVEARLARAVRVQSLAGMGGLVGYLSKELGKSAQKVFPEGYEPGRWWGHWGLDEVEAVEPDFVPATAEQLARLGVANDMWSTWGVSHSGRVAHARGRWSGDMASWVVYGRGKPRCPT